MVDNVTFVGKINETGKVITVILKESNSAGTLVPKDITGYTNIKMQVKTKQGAVVMDQVPCVITSAAAGEITCTTDLTVALHPGLIVSPEKTPHLLEFSGLNSAGKKRYWPINANGERTYGRCVIQNALA